jgi:DMSO/TMAO reductase YedYZ molybdopterin-dependent catalytic subunit
MRMTIMLGALLLLTIAPVSLTGCSELDAPVSPPGEGEALEYMGTRLTPIDEQGNYSLEGTQEIDEDTYRLAVDGMVENPLNLSYSDLTEYPQESRLIDLNCVGGWDFTAKWTGPELNVILDDAVIDPGSRILIFYTADAPDGYTSLDISYIREEDIIIALKLNDVVLPAERGFPFQVVAEGKFGYKWAKWVTRIEVSDDEDFRGYWERNGYNNNADIDDPAFETIP